VAGGRLDRSDVESDLGTSRTRAAYNIQVSGLEQRLRAIGLPTLVIGVSGGLDSTHALIVAAWLSHAAPG
jgi:NH3-dependent NAD+ synthetase